MNVVFFGRLREQIGISSLEIIETIETVGALKERLKQRDKRWFDAFSESEVLVAVNQTLCDETQILKSTDEVAFFPPVTGG